MENPLHTPPAPFSCTFSPNLPEFLSQIPATLVISTYQAGKVIFISPKNAEELVQLPRTFLKAMGIAVEGTRRMAIATRDEVIYTVNSPELGQAYPRKPQTYDAFYLPTATYYTGMVDLHDLHFGHQDSLWAINTSFSALCKIDRDYSFLPVWKPPFISELASEDRCHLNGLAMREGVPRYVSALGQGNSPQSWREGITTGGIVMDIQSNEIIAQGLGMPHSPRWHQGHLLVLLSAEERIIALDPQTGKSEPVAKVSGFVRGMALYGDYAFVGKSKLRKNSSTFKHLKIADKASEAGLDVIHLPSGTTVATLRYQASVDEIYDVQILPGVLRPNVLNTYEGHQKQALLTPGATFWGELPPREP
ncbi:MAG: TIGR03032 family protein [Microscillaceae bacterium]|nr:TIGR03032 family protein [Microscillaceae bacterium]